jgi:uncharacterized protein
MPNAFIIHGAGSSSRSNWFPWLKTELERIGIKTAVPDFPIGLGEGREDQGGPDATQSLDNWLAAFGEYAEGIDEGTLMIGHSVGPAFILAVLERLDVRISAAFLVAPFTERLGIERFDRVNGTFMRLFNWERIKKNCGRFRIYASDNDPYVPQALSRRVAENLGAELKVVPGAGHFNSDSGYTRFDLLLKDMEEAAAAR